MSLSHKTCFTHYGFLIFQIGPFSARPFQHTQIIKPIPKNTKVKFKILGQSFYSVSDQISDNLQFSSV